MAITKIIACSDVHMPSLKGIDELKKHLERFIGECKDIIEGEESPDNVRIVVCGDIFHSKTNVTNESIMAVNWFFSELDKLCRTYIIIGNHDFLMNNLDRVDSITPLFEIGNYNQVVFLDKELGYKSGIYNDDNVALCLYSCFSGFNTPDIAMHKEALKDNPSKPETYVGLIHGDVNGAVTTTNYLTENGIDPNVFEGLDFVIAGHIHKQQEIKKNGVRTVYCSSLMQQNFGESVTGHGYVLWDISDPEDITYEFVDVPNDDCGYFKFGINSIEDIENDDEELINY